MLPKLIQRYHKNHFIFYSVQKREINWNFTDCQMLQFMVVLLLYINLLNLSWIKMSTFEEYGTLFKFLDKYGNELAVRTFRITFTL